MERSIAQTDPRPPGFRPDGVGVPGGPQGRWRCSLPIHGRRVIRSGAMGTPSSTVMIHGHAWPLDDIRDDIEWCRRGSWTKAVYGAGPALVDRCSGTIREYWGQHYDPKHFELREQEWGMTTASSATGRSRRPRIRRSESRTVRAASGSAPSAMSSSCVKSRSRRDGGPVAGTPRWNDPPRDHPCPRVLTRGRVGGSEGPTAVREAEVGLDAWAATLHAGPGSTR